MRMRFKQGDKVEVMNDREMPISWRPAEILSSHCETYTVRYEFYHGMTNNRVIEQIPKDSVRPCPPQVMGIESYDAGDVVEVFHDYSWNVAAVLKILQVQRVGRRITNHNQATMSGYRYLIRLLGFSIQLIVDKSNIRMRRTWDDGTWMLMEKNFRAAGYLTATKVPSHDDTSIWEPNILKSKKRMSPFDSPTANRHSGRIQKLRIVEKKGLRHKVTAALMPEKVHAVAYPIMGEHKMHGSNEVMSNRCNQMGNAEHYNYVNICEFRSTDDNDTCSVASCSITSKGVNCRYRRHPITEEDAICSDAESHCGSESDRETSPPPPNLELEVSIHWLELNAYRCTLQALFVSGPLTWDQEALLTNLRRLLHISNDEHLKELKLLKSSPITV